MHRLRRGIYAYVAGGFDPSALVYFNAMAVAPTAAYAAKLNARIIALKAAGLWDLCDWVSWFDVETEQQSMLNAKNPALTMAKVSTPTFVAGTGWTGNSGTTGYLDSDWDPSTDGVNFTRNGAFAAAWIANNVAVTENACIGNDTNYIRARNASSQFVMTPQTTSTVVASIGAGTAGLVSWQRTASNAAAIYKNGTSLATSGAASAALDTDDFFVCAQNNAGTPSIGATTQVKGVAWGANLGGDAGQAAFYTAFTAV